MGLEPITIPLLYCCMHGQLIKIFYEIEAKSTINQGVFTQVSTLRLFLTMIMKEDRLWIYTQFRKAFSTAISDHKVSNISNIYFGKVWEPPKLGNFQIAHWMDLLFFSDTM